MQYKNQENRLLNCRLLFQRENNLFKSCSTVSFLNNFNLRLDHIHAAVLFT